MNDVLIVYESGYGSTETYAKHIGKALSARTLPASKLKAADLNGIRTVVIGSNVRISKLPVLKRIKRHKALLRNKRVLFFAVGLTDSSDGIFDKLSSDNPDLESLNAEALYYYPGAFDVSTFKWRHRMLMKFLKFALSKNQNRSAEEDGLLNAIENPVDERDMTLTTSLVEKVKEG